MKKGLVLEGGALRGLFTAGVIDVMMEAGIDFDGLIGVSAGAASVVTIRVISLDVSYVITNVMPATGAIAV